MASEDARCRYRLGDHLGKKPLLRPEVPIDYHRGHPGSLRNLPHPDSFLACPQAVVADIEAKGDRADMALGDLMTADSIEAVVKTTNHALGGIDILVNNAGSSNSGSAAGWFETPVDEWTESYRQNGLPVVRLAHAFVTGDARSPMESRYSDLVAQCHLRLRTARPLRRGEGGTQQSDA
jgi:NAD(P)-dependent dehydrogenase (short-subunit alcohol dehydrogenase family)